MSPKKITKPLDVYVRVSDVKGRVGESFIAPEEQTARCRAAATARGLKIGEVLQELNVSGSKMDRPVLNEAIGRIREGVSGGIIVARIDRFGRTVVGALKVLEEISEAGGVVITAEGDFDTSTAVGELVLNMMLSLAQFELRRISDNWRDAKRSAVERGVHISPHAPPGYVRGADKRLVPDEKHGKTVAEAFAMAARGESYSIIASFLTEQGLPSGGKTITWEPNRIKRLLANHVYLGEGRYGVIVNPSAHEPLVDAITWNLAQRTQTGAPISNQQTRMLAGICRCASCSYAMRSQAPRASVIGTYRCRTTSPNGRCEHPATIGLTRLEDYVIEQFLARVASMTLHQNDGQDDATEAAQAAVEAEQRYRGALTNTALQEKLGEEDHFQFVMTLKDKWQEALAAVPAPTRPARTKSVDIAGLVEELRRREDAQSLRELLATEIQAVFVRPAKSRARNLPIEDRVRIVWADEPQLNLPKRGELFTPRPYTWA